MRGFVAMLLLLAVSAFLGGSVFAATANVPIKVTLGEFFFKPAKIEAKAGQVEFAVTNMGVIAHDFHIFDVKGKMVKPEPGAMPKGHGHAVIGPGKAMQFRYTLKAGTYEIRCTLPGHFEAGQKAVLLVK